MCWNAGPMASIAEIGKQAPRAIVGENWLQGTANRNCGQTIFVEEAKFKAATDSQGWFRKRFLKLQIGFIPEIRGRSSIRIAAPLRDPA